MKWDGSFSGKIGEVLLVAGNKFIRDQKEADMFKLGGVWWTCIRYEGKKVQKSLELEVDYNSRKIESANA